MAADADDGQRRADEDDANDHFLVDGCATNSLNYAHIISREAHYDEFRVFVDIFQKLIVKKSQIE